MTPQLDAIEARVLGSLMEKELATPDYYPLSLNALTNACNQKTNRNPVLVLDEGTVGKALHSLKEKRHVYQSDASRVPKFWQAFAKQQHLTPRETALLALLLLRGPQTMGELRSRSESMCAFDSLEEVALSLENLISTGLAAQLPRQPGQKEQRFSQLLSTGEPVSGGLAAAGADTVLAGQGGDRLAQLEETVALLQEELARLQADVAALRGSVQESAG